MPRWNDDENSMFPAPAGMSPGSIEIPDMRVNVPRTRGMSPGSSPQKLERSHVPRTRGDEPR
ncbi:Uncharacterised protein [Rothia dentocariosa]|uniref:Uncharacterized protein n=1 Tax=Rothia dentocariosa TaxID=2047 RepID=A0A448UTI0_9MICC|nr:Uncharacterised protein [Rothia dentocariosa]